MADASEEGMVNRLRAFLYEKIGRHLGRREQKESFAHYAMGIVGEGARKSVEPIAARATGDAKECENMQARLLNFLRDSPWSDRAVRQESARHVVAALESQEPVTTWIIDDTGFPKQGKHSVGVQRQYSGTLGKVGNCQIGVSLTLATRSEHVPIDMALYMPKSWIDDPERRKKARVPEKLSFKTKPELAIELIERAVENKIPGKVLLADAGYGNSSEFRNKIREQGLDFGVGIQSSTKVWVLDNCNRRRGAPMSAKDLGIKLKKAFRRLTWRDGPGGKLASRFAFQRVKVAHDDGTEAGDREPLWLVLEWPEGELHSTKFVLTTLRERMSKKEIVRTFKERWRTERAYQELKGELGLDHFEGRSFPGWNHHVSVVLCCYAFIISERVRQFSPSLRRDAEAVAIVLAA